jgi:protein-disulfide isomerase
MIKATLLLIIVTLAFAPAMKAKNRGASDSSRAQSASPVPAQAQSKGSSEVKPAAKEEDCGCDGKVPPDVIAIVNGVQVSSKEIDDAIKDRVQELQRQIIDARKRELDLQINTRLLEAEAKKRGIPTAKLIEVEITSKIAQPTEAEAQAFYDQNKSRIEGAFKDVKADVIRYLLDQRRGELAATLAKRLRGEAKVSILVPPESVTPPATPADRARLLATVNGARITSGDIEDALLPAVSNVQDQVHELRKTQLDMKINDVLLEQEAQKRKITARALFEAEVLSKMKGATDADAQKFYQENKERITGEFAQLKDQIIQYLKQQEQQAVEKTFADGLRQAAAVKVMLAPPEAPVLNISVDDQPVKGIATAPVTIVEFTDFECPSCARTQPVLEEIVNEYSGKVRLVVRDFPLDQHTHALKAAEAAEAAREQGKYWEYTALMFKNQSALEVDKLKEYATQVGLDRKRFDLSLDSGKYSDKVQQDVQDGYRLGVNATPTVFINGRKMRERTPEFLKSVIDAALKGPVK